ncbi:MAG TPA: hypothetical protein VMS73_08610 [Anaerolineaceae bacterium]|nr:hypothetical protein [Anaerolineaceae bacterium]
MRRKSLPEPDFLDFTLPEGSVAVITDDGSDATPAVVRALAGLEWKVVVLNFPDNVVNKISPLPTGVSRASLVDMSEEELQRKLAEIGQKHGAIAAFIHLHPASNAELNGSIHFPEADRALVRQVFLAAKHLKEPLNQAARQGRSIFMSVAHLDGEFGLGGDIPFSPVSGGLFGLVKTLNLEWEPVFCRALDISPMLDASQLAADVVAELHDPNRLITEVAYNLEGRSTLIVEQVVKGQVTQ